MDRPLVVLQSFPTPRPTTNPYIVMLAQAIAKEPELELQAFSYKAALLGRFDVFHAHWPENLVQGRTPVRQFARSVLFAMFLLRIQMSRKPLVRTTHNLEMPKGLNRLQRNLLGWTDRLTTLRIRINPTTPVNSSQPSVLLVHGHYIDWYGRYELPQTTTGRLAFVGLIRRYKGVEDLITAFREVPDDPSGALTLAISGNPTSDELGQHVRDLTEGDRRVLLDLRFLPDEDLVRAVGAAEMVVLPYRHMHNSGGVLTALSLSRPVLVPANEANAQLAAEVGPGWVHQFDGELTALSITETLERLRLDPPADPPDLTRRSWDHVGQELADIYRLALRLKRGDSGAIS